MPRQAIDDWLPYLDEALAFMDELDADFKVGTLDRAGIVALRDQLQATLSALNSLQAQTGLKMGERDQEIDEIEDFAVKFRSAVIARYGPGSSQAERCPKLKRRSRSSTESKPPVTEK